MKLLIDCVMYQVTALVACILFMLVLLTMLPGVPLMILATPAVLFNDCDPRTRKPWNQLEGWERVLMAPYLGYHKLVIEKVWRQKQRFI